jgi:uncharacterized membrane protein
LKRDSRIESQVKRWTDAGILDSAAGNRIIEFEHSQEHSASLRWPVLVALVFGGILLAAGITLFVAAHWSELSPAFRFTLVLFMVSIFHLAGAFAAEKFPALSITCHAIGTATLGAAIFLAGQIFNLQENWATGILLWAIGAAFGYLLLRNWPQAALLALLVPAWLIGQWAISTQWYSNGSRPLALGLLSTAFTYFSARIGNQESAVRKALVWIGGLALIPCAITALVLSTEEPYGFRNSPSLPALTLFLIWVIALFAPLIFAWLVRGKAVWMNLLAVAWSYAFIVVAAHARLFPGRGERDVVVTLTLYLLCVLVSAGLVAWGLYEKRKERLNLGIVSFAISVLFFYFDSFMGKLGRSASLLVLGVLCLVGGYALEMTRRKLRARMELNP